MAYIKMAEIEIRTKSSNFDSSLDGHNRRG
jgi:hypothetical protein